MNPEARRIIELTRAARTPNADDRDRVRRALAITLAATAAAAPGVAAGATAVKAAAAGTAAKTFGALGAAGGLKLALSVAVIASVGVGAYWWTRPAPAPATVVAPMAAPAAKAVTVDPPVVEQPAAAPAEIAPDAAPPVGSMRDPLLAELSLLNRAQRAWRQGAAGKALDLAQQHAQRYPRSKLALERDAVRVFALCALGRRHQAHSLAIAIVKRAPRSPLRTSVEESCGMR
ncbi:MAG TPA: hypothetical protein VFH73_21645 [Polyangia bacterium]|nr:hypothetical protein [Polyangia bacterium]